MTSMTDPKGNQTNWTRDIEGRVSAKRYSDGSATNYEYDSFSGRLQLATDAKNQYTEYFYDVDDKLLHLDYVGAQNPTPNVSFQYDLTLGRLVQMTDGTGTTGYSYWPITPGILGAGRLRTVSSPVGGASANITYAYDADGRTINQAIDGVSENYNYNGSAQLANVTNSLGAFGYNYDSASARLTQVTYPNGQKTQMDYYTPSTNSGRLKDITNLNSGSQTLSAFNYNYDSVGDITNWTKQLGNASSDTETLTLGYDPDSQLSSVNQVNANSSPSEATTYAYDAAGNRTLEQLQVGTGQTGSFIHTFAVNNANQLTSITPNPIHVVAATNRAAAVTVNGSPTTMSANGNYEADLVPAANSGQTPMTVLAIAKDGTVTQIHKHVLNTQPFVYDADGNLIQDDQKTYQWDAANRLVSVSYINPQPVTVADSVTFQYDGMGRRTAIAESHNGTVLAAKTFVWCGLTLCQERDVTGKTITKRFFGLGEQIINGTSGTNYYYTKDHLGSVREMTDSSGNLQAQYDYDAYGKQKQIAGTLQADFGYTGFYLEKAAGLDLTLFRAYDPEKGRWISRDPLGESYGPSLYVYNFNDPSMVVDKDGGQPIPAPAIAVLYYAYKVTEPELEKIINDLPDKCELAEKLEDVLDDMTADGLTPPPAPTTNYPVQPVELPDPSQSSSADSDSSNNNSSGSGPAPTPQQAPTPDDTD